MRVTAARLVQHGQPLQIEEVDIADPGDQEAILEVAYAGVNPVDMYAAQGRVAPDAPVPRTLGGEGAGTVDGRPVMVRGYGLGTTRDGLWASAAVVPRGALIDVPAGVDLSAAATMGVAGVTAWRTVAEVAAVNADDTVLVLGARGGVGSIIVSLAHSLGATVAGQTGHEDNHDWITAHGADYVVVSDAAGLDEALADLRPTVVFDPLGGEFTGAAIEILQPYGRLVLFGASAGPEGLVPLRTLYRKGISLLSYAGLLATDEELGVAIRESLEALAAGTMKVTIDSAMPLKQVNDAFTRIASRDVRGKIVLDTRS
ncbi:MAG TPA: zinc-binding alcohol dehydrogenase family protein [Streptosporangiaceae bacterium]|jgi:NADPH2:quinone reductase|nr:zinc-binding alcohol dehydrogenase family protein [Streptosporangiaceae bacterium]